VNNEWQKFSSRFNGFGARQKTVETVLIFRTASNTGLKPRC
jgi:hypothetical protein